jgi:hypothetical protein
MDTAAEDFDSTLVRRGFRATTFNEVAAFAADVEDRPLERLLFDLPGIAELSDVKFSLARQVIRRRAKVLSEVDRAQLRVIADEIASAAPTHIAVRIRNLFL